MVTFYISRISIRIAIGITLLIFLLAGLVHAHIPEEPYDPLFPDELFNEPEIPGRIEANGTHFKLNNSLFSNLTLDSSELIKLSLDQGPEMIIIHFEAILNTSSTEITLSGFFPKTTYQKDEGDPDNQTVFTTDSNGNYSYIQNISEPHYVFISEAIQEPDLNNILYVPGRLEANGTYFELNDSEYLNISLESSEPINLTLESIPEMVTLRIESMSNANSTQITLNGFTPQTTYHKYEGNYHNHISFTTNVNGSYSYIQDLTNKHLVFIQPRMSTKFINDNATGGDCTSIGIWDAVNKTCTLTTDLTETIQIDSNGIILDGNNHLISGSGTGNGIYLYEKTDVTIKNLKIERFFNGIYLQNSSNINITSNEIGFSSGRNRYGIYLDSSNNNNLIDNIASRNYYYGISLDYSDNNNLIRNIANENDKGIFLQNSNNNNLTKNTADKNRYNGISLSYSSNNILIENNAKDNNPHGVPRYYGYGFSILYSNNNNIKNNTAESNRYLGFYSSNSINNTFTNNIILNNKWSFKVHGIQDSHFDHNIDISNLANGKPIYYIKNAINQSYDESTNAGTFYCINCTNVTIKGLTLTGNMQGIFLWKTKDSTIENNLVSNNLYGIFLKDSRYNIIKNNLANHNWCGIYSESSNNNNLTSNTITPINNYYQGIGDGMRFFMSNNNTLFGNTASNGDVGIYFQGSNNNTLERNNISFNSHYGVRLLSSNNNTLIRNTALNDLSKAYRDFYPYGILLGHSNNNNLISNNASGNAKGIVLYNYLTDPKNNGNNISNNTVSNNNCGIYIRGFENNTLINNSALNNTGYGIHIELSANNTLIDNVASNNSIGIIIKKSIRNILIDNIASNNNNFGISLYNDHHNLTGNIMSANRYNFLLSQGHGLTFNNISKSNTVDGRPIYYEKNVVNEIYDSSTNAGIFYCIDCDNVSITGLTPNKNSLGILLWNTKNSTIGYNIVSDNLYYGIGDFYGNNNTFSHNIVSKAVRGFEIYNSVNNTLEMNNISNNSIGIDLVYNINGKFKSENSIYHNNFINNTYYQARDTLNCLPSWVEGGPVGDCVNYWDDGYPSGGNYWSDYTGTDNFYGVDQDIPGSDDIGDTPYQISNNYGYYFGSMDHYPLMKPWESDTTPIDDLNKLKYDDSILFIDSTPIEDNESKIINISSDHLISAIALVTNSALEDITTNSVVKIRIIDELDNILWEDSFDGTITVSSINGDSTIDVRLTNNVNIPDDSNFYGTKKIQLIAIPASDELDALFINRTIYISPFLLEPYTKGDKTYYRILQDREVTGSNVGIITSPEYEQYFADSIQHKTREEYDPSLTTFLAQQELYGLTELRKKYPNSEVKIIPIDPDHKMIEKIKWNINDFRNRGIKPLIVGAIPHNKIKYSNIELSDNYDSTYLSFAMATEINNEKYWDGNDRQVFSSSNFRSDEIIKPLLKDNSNYSATL